MVKKKLCPMKQDEGDKTYICCEDDCAWWNNDFGQCAIAAMARTMTIPVMLKETFG